jgi:acyl-lipid omega-6 desaturase (Delta-12 desaturase)
MTAELTTSEVAAGSSQTPSVKDVRANFDEHAHRKSTFKGLALFGVSIIPYILGYWGFIALEGWWLKILCAAVFTGAIPALFIIGHDACHQALTPHSWLNKIVGRIAMLPGYHAFAVWDYGHNSLHHGWTNVKTKDLVWTPLSKAEYDALSPVYRWVHRMYRTWWGVGPYYMIEMWIKFGMTQAKAKNAKTNRLFWMDRLSVVAFAIAQIVAVLFMTNRAALGSSPLWVSIGLLAVGVIIPQLLWNWLMGFVVFLHHTHPSVPWYGNEKDWTFYAGQIQSVVHVELPRPVELILHNIMEHTAHHVDPRIPLYNLEDCQKKLEEAYGGEIVHVPFTMRGYIDTLRKCRLFDYENFRWLNWNGEPTTEALLQRDDDGRLLKSGSPAVSC